MFVVPKKWQGVVFLTNSAIKFKNVGIRYLGVVIYYRPLFKVGYVTECKTL